jgi:hypothetical protein
MAVGVLTFIIIWNMDSLFSAHSDDHHGMGTFGAHFAGETQTETGPGLVLCSSHSHPHFSGNQSIFPFPSGSQEILNDDGPKTVYGCTLNGDGPTNNNSINPLFTFSLGDAQTETPSNGEDLMGKV